MISLNFGAVNSSKSAGDLAPSKNGSINASNSGCNSKVFAASASSSRFFFAALAAAVAAASSAFRFFSASWGNIGILSPKQVRARTFYPGLYKRTGTSTSIVAQPTRICDSRGGIWTMNHSSWHFYDVELASMTGLFLQYYCTVYSGV